MSPKLPINNSQTITEFLNLHHNQISEEDSEDSYKFAFDDEAFLSRRETIGIRFELELLKPELLLKEHGIEHTITVFGSTRFVSHQQAISLEEKAKTPDEIVAANKAILHSKYYESAREFGAQEALQMGIVAEIHSSEQIHERAASVARALAIRASAESSNIFGRPVEPEDSTKRATSSATSLGRLLCS